MGVFCVGREDSLSTAVYVHLTRRRRTRFLCILAIPEGQSRMRRCSVEKRLLTGISAVAEAKAEAETEENSVCLASLQRQVTLQSVSSCCSSSNESQSLFRLRWTSSTYHHNGESLSRNSYDVVAQQQKRHSNT